MILKKLLVFTSPDHQQAAFPAWSILFESSDLGASFLPRAGLCHVFLLLLHGSRAHTRDRLPPCQSCTLVDSVRAGSGISHVDGLDPEEFKNARITVTDDGIIFSVVDDGESDRENEVPEEVWEREEGTEGEERSAVGGVEEEGRDGVVSGEDETEEEEDEGGEAAAGVMEEAQRVMEEAAKLLSVAERPVVVDVAVSDSEEEDEGEAEEDNEGEEEDEEQEEDEAEEAEEAEEETLAMGAEEQVGGRDGKREEEALEALEEEEPLVYDPPPQADSNVDLEATLGATAAGSSAVADSSYSAEGGQDGRGDVEALEEAPIYDPPASVDLGVGLERTLGDADAAGASLVADSSYGAGDGFGADVSSVGDVSYSADVSDGAGDGFGADVSSVEEEERRVAERLKALAGLALGGEEGIAVRGEDSGLGEVRAGETVDIFFHRPASVLKEKAGIFVVGAFNEWQWEPFKYELKPSNEVANDWWTCSVTIPKEAYQMNFVFHSSDNVYENNEGRDFYISIDGGMGEDEFERFLNEQKQREAEERAAEEAERERKAEEERRAALLRAQQEEERATARAVADEARQRLGPIWENAGAGEEGVWRLEVKEGAEWGGKVAGEGGGVEKGVVVRVEYNRAGRPLAGAGEVWLHAGVNGWQGGVSVVEKLECVNNEDGDWWAVEVTLPQAAVALNRLFAVALPQDAVALNWVFADGPVGKAGAWDNNSRRDFAGRIGDAEQIEALFEGMVAECLQRLEKEREERDAKEAEEAARRAEIKAAMKARTKAVFLQSQAHVFFTEPAIPTPFSLPFLPSHHSQQAARRAEIKAAMKARTKAVFLQSQAHVFFTEPAEPRAGEAVRVYYNPSGTALQGREKVWMRGSFNRWTHRSGCFLPLQMEPADNGTHLVAEVPVPHDAYIMDLVFMDSSDPTTATYDNRGGLDYHVPVAGSTAREPPLYIVHVALEMAPVAKVGGLGDVVTSLSRATIELGHRVEVVLPKYDCLKYDQVQGLEARGDFLWGGTRWLVWHGRVEGIPVHFLEPESGLFWVGCIYGRKDDAARFGTFCHAALEFLLQTGRSPDLLHCHDWSSAPVAWLQREQYSGYGGGNARTVFTIHNLEFGQDMIGRAMAACDMATTVSPTYAAEVSGHAAVAAHRAKFHGILNGIDPDLWDPMGDPFLPVSAAAVPMKYSAAEVVEGKQTAKAELRACLNLRSIPPSENRPLIKYSAAEVVEGKQAAKAELRARLNLRSFTPSEDRPLVGIVTRLTAQKGIALIKHALWRTLDRGGQVVLLGSAPDGRVQGEFEALARDLGRSHGDMARLWLTYDEPLSHLVSVLVLCAWVVRLCVHSSSMPVVHYVGERGRQVVLLLGPAPEELRWHGTSGVRMETWPACGSPTMSRSRT
ncbi:unnamed protein product, partial [Closterium sp. NIES-64]